MWDYIINNFLLIYILELGAALAGTYYISKIPHPKTEVRWFVYYLWLVVLVELIGLYPTFAYFENYKTLSFIQGTPFERNYWWYNGYAVIKFFIFFKFFIGQLSSEKMRKTFNVISYFILGSFILNLVFSGILFKQFSLFISIVGTSYLTLLIFIYYLNILRSNQILTFYRSLPFYISVGLLIWHLVITPLFIYSRFFNLSSPEFVALHSIILKAANIFLYGLLITGFIICSGKGEEMEVDGNVIKV